MKIFLLTLLFCSSAFATENWFPFGKVGAKTSWMKKSDCESQEGQKCYDISQKDVRKMKVGFVIPDVHETFDCEDATKCQEAIDQAGSCSESWTFDEKSNWPGLDFSGQQPSRQFGWFAWCQKKDLVEDSAKKATVDAEDAAKAQAQAMEAEGAKAIKVGLQAKNLMAGYIKLKGLPKAQRKQLRGDLKSIIEALDVGSIDIAIDEVKALTEDGVVVTPEAKALILKVFEDAGYSI